MKRPDELRRDPNEKNDAGQQLTDGEVSTENAPDTDVVADEGEGAE